MDESGEERKGESDGGTEDGEAWVRGKKKLRLEDEWIRGAGMGSFGNSKEGVSFKDKLLDADPKACSVDGRGSNVFDEAWREHIEGLKSFFGDDGEALKKSSNEKVDSEDDDTIPKLVVTQEEYERWCAPWRKSLIIKVLGKDIPLWGMKAALKRLWKTKEAFVTRDIDNGYFVVSFKNDEDLNYVYFEGPWMVADHYLLVQRWRPNFDSWNAECNKKIAAWIQIPLLPLEFSNSESLNKISRLIGQIEDSKSENIRFKES